MRLIFLLPLAALAGCGDTRTNVSDAAIEGSGGELVNAAPAEPMADNGANAIAPGPDWTGRWTGVEGTYLVVTPSTAPGSYRLEMQYTLDDKGVFEGMAGADGIAFTRPDGSHTLHPSDGDATGLKYLAGKKDCLTVKPGEGYCRD